MVNKVRGSALEEQRASNPQKGAEAGGLPKLSSGLLSKTEIRHHNAFQQAWHPARTGWHEPHVSQEQRRKGKQRDRVVNKVRGSALEEAAQEVQEEAKDRSPGTEATCPEQMQTDPDPFVETPGSTTEPPSKTMGETQEMEFL